MESTEVRPSLQRRSDNVTVQLPNTAPVIPVLYMAPHPCGGYYVEDARVYGLSGLIGRYIS